MLRKLYAVATILGFAPILGVRKHYWLLPLCLLIGNQIRFLFVTFLLICRIFNGQLSILYGAMSFVSNMFQQVFITICLYTTLTKRTKFRHIQKLLVNIESISLYEYSLYLLCLIFYIIVCLLEKRKNHYEVFSYVTYTWINYHVCQCLQFFHLTFVQYVVSVITIKYKKFNSNLCKHFVLIKSGSADALFMQKIKWTRETGFYL